MRSSTTRSSLWILWSLAVAILAASGSSVALEMYKWTDENGVLHVATSLDDVPAKYRDQVRAMKMGDVPDTGSAAASPPSPAVPSSLPAQPSLDPSGLLRFSIPYKHEGSARRVIIPVKFNDAVTAPMALDTGSPGMVISLDLAVRIGVFERNRGTLLTTAGGIGGETLAILTIVDSVSVEGARDVFVPTTVTAGMSQEFEGLIGMDFLANYTISIDSRNKLVLFQQTPPLPGTRGGHDEAWWRKTFEDFSGVADAWRNYVRSASRRSGTRVTPFAEFQARESERLLQRLHLYASENAVPRHWR